MKRLDAYKKDLYELRFSPMCKPAGEVANLTQLESHTIRARTMMLWRIAEGIIDWGPREVELLYESTLDSISEAFDVFHYPISQYMAAARADVWEVGLAPECVKSVLEASTATLADKQPTVSVGGVLLLAGEIAQLGDDALLTPMSAALQAAGIEASVWVAPTGALAYALGALDAARAQAAQIVEGIQASGAQTVIADGPETAWALSKIYPALGIDLPQGVTVRLLSVTLDQRLVPTKRDIGVVFVHDSRPACLIAERMANSLAIIPGYSVLSLSKGTGTEGESAFGEGAVYAAPRHLLDAMGAQRVFGTWTRALAKTSGADDGLWLTYTDLAAGLAAQRLDYAQRLGATMLVTDSPLAVAYLSKHAAERKIEVRLLAELLP
ncbi:MAG: hypothetical protein ABIK79_05630 [Chloroflexota bacterium]